MSSRVEHGATLCTNTHGQLNIVSSSWLALPVCSVYMQGHMEIYRVTEIADGQLYHLCSDYYTWNWNVHVYGTNDTTHLSYLLRNSE